MSFLGNMQTGVENRVISPELAERGGFSVARSA